MMLRNTNNYIYIVPHVVEEKEILEAYDTGKIKVSRPSSKEIEASNCLLDYFVF